MCARQTPSKTPPPNSTCRAWSSIGPASPGTSTCAAAHGWEAREFRGTRWQAIHGGNDGLGRADYVRNAYRVLLTRARQGMVIFVPKGDAEDATRPAADYDAIDAWLADCGVPALPG